MRTQGGRCWGPRLLPTYTVISAGQNAQPCPVGIWAHRHIPGETGFVGGVG